MPFDVPKIVQARGFPDDTPIIAKARLPRSSVNFVRQFVPDLQQLDGDLGLDVDVNGTFGHPVLSGAGDMGVVCFRFSGAAARGRAGSIDRVDKINSDIVERINASGRAYLTQTKLRGRTVMRIGLGNVLTTEGHLRKGWEIIQETAEAAQPKSQTNFNRPSPKRAERN